MPIKIKDNNIFVSYGEHFIYKRERHTNERKIFSAYLFPLYFGLNVHPILLISILWTLLILLYNLLAIKSLFTFIYDRSP